MSYIATLVLSYFVVAEVFRPEHSDDAWGTSWFYNFVHKGTDFDVCFGAIPRHSSGLRNQVALENPGLIMFGKTQAYLYGAILDTVGWTRHNVHRISQALIFAATFVWWRITRHIFKDINLSVAFVLTFLLAEPALSSATIARPEALTFFLASTATYCFFARRLFLATLLGCVAFEVHPLGVITGVYILSALIQDRRRLLREILPVSAASSCIIGVAIGGSYYIWLHWGWVHELLQLHQMVGRDGNSFVAYFFRMKYYRHLPELLVLLAATLVYFRKGYWRETPFVTTLAALSFGLATLITRANIFYMLYFLPAALLLMLYVAQREHLLVTFMVLCLINGVAQFSAAYYLNRHWSFERYVAAVQPAVPNDKLLVVGNFNDWFLFKDRDFVGLNSRLALKSRPSAFYLIRGPDYRNDNPAALMALKKTIEYEYDVERLKSVQVNSEVVEVCLARRKVLPRIVPAK